MAGLSKSLAAKRAADVLEEQNRQARRAFELRQQGKSWWDISEELGITEAMAMNRVDEAIRSASQLVDEYTRRSFLVMEVSRLDALQDAHWGNAIGGNIKAAELILKISAQRAKLLGLDSTQAVQQTVHTVIVQGTTEEYIQALQQAAGGRADG